jgi:hypothetical protein
MAQMTPAQARVVDPVLTSVAQGYKNAAMVGMALFPRVPVTARGGKIISFSKEDFRLYNTQRTPGAKTSRVQFGYSSGSYALEDHSLEALVPFEIGQEAAQSKINVQARSVNGVQRIMALRLEYQQAGLATNAASYASGNKVTLSGTSQWSDYSGTSDPVANIETGKEAVRAAIGLRPNTVILGPLVFKAVKQHPKILDRIKYTSGEYVTAQMLARLWDVEQVLIGDAVYEDAAGALADVWGKFAVLAYATPASLADYGAPSYGYTYGLDGYPLVEAVYQDRNAKSDVHPVTDATQPVLTSAAAGYLISGAVA